MNKKIQGKKNRASGQRFELRVKKDLESKGWIVSKWMNNVELPEINNKAKLTFKFKNKEESGIGITLRQGRLVPAKHKFRGPGIPMAIGTGFPDFVCILKYEHTHPNWRNKDFRVVNGVEVKSNGYLDKTEKQKCKWLLDNHIFSKILVAKKGKKRGEIIYNEFK